MKLTPTEYRGVRGYQDEAGKFYPSTGSILDILLGSSVGWIDEKYLAEGTLCHEEMKLACDLYQIKGRWTTSLNPRVQALITHLETWGFIPLEAEQPRCSTLYGYAGTPDALMTRGGVYVVPDWKFAESVDERYQYQLESYQHFFYHLEVRPALMIFKVNREAKVTPIVVKPKAQHWAEFLAALTVMKRRLR